LPFSAQADRRWFSHGQHVLFHWCSDRLAAHRSVYLPISSGESSVWLASSSARDWDDGRIQ
jgi:hypothetical protein